MKRAAAGYRAPSEHYENFPVASWLCPPSLRAPIAAIYWFARTADDLADEGSTAASARLASLQSYRLDLLAVAQGRAHAGRWPAVFEPLGAMIARFSLPTQPLSDLLDAFEQDVRFTAESRRYQSATELYDYCRRSANPVGRLLLHLYGVRDELSMQQSDAICTALQLVNFWQDLRADIAQGRWYLPANAMRRHGVSEVELAGGSPSAGARELLACCVADAERLMRRGAPLAERIPGRAGWELRLVVQGGLRIAEKMAAMGFATWRERPRLSRADLPVLAWRAWRRQYRLPLPVAA